MECYQYHEVLIVLVEESSSIVQEAPIAMAELQRHNNRSQLNDILFTRIVHITTKLSLANNQ